MTEPKDKLNPRTQPGDEYERGENLPLWDGEVEHRYPPGTIEQKLKDFGIVPAKRGRRGRSARN